MKYFSLYADFFVHVLERYIPRAVYKVSGPHSDLMDQMTLISSRDFEKWSHLPISYLSNMESLALGIYTFYSTSQKKSELSYKYFEQILENHFINKEEVAYLASVGLGIIYFDKMRKESKENQANLLHKAKIHFKKANSIMRNQELCLFYLALTEVASDDMPMAITYLRRAAKISHRADKIYHILSCIYLNMRYEKIAEFYRIKGLKWKERGEFSYAS